MITRRRLLALLPAAALQTRLDAGAQIFRRNPKSPPLPQPLVFFGTDTSRPAAKGIYLARFDANAGRFSTPILAAPCIRPAYLALNEIAHREQPQQVRHLLYATNEGDANNSTVTTYSLDPGNGALTPLSQVSAGGLGPCYIAVDASGQSAYVANYAGGTIASYAVLHDGTLSEPVDRVDFHNQKIFGHHGPNKARQDGPHPHSTMLSPDNRFVIVNDLGNDDIAIFPIDAKTAHLGTPHLYQSLTPASGPRHMAFHPNQRWAYGINEIASRIDQYLYTSTHAAVGVEAEAILTGAGHSVSTVATGFRGVNTAAEIVVTPTGDFVYASNRGEDSLVVYSIDEIAGTLTFVQRISCGGKTPRHFTLDHSTNWIVCGNQDSASVTVFARDGGSGRLSGPVQTLPLESPMFTLFV
jgi:6-phosphogluconolactonase